jgi:hypothetical protein
MSFFAVYTYYGDVRNEKGVDVHTLDTYCCWSLWKARDEINRIATEYSQTTFFVIKRRMIESTKDLIID